METVKEELQGFTDHRSFGQIAKSALKAIRQLELEVSRERRLVGVLTYALEEIKEKGQRPAYQAVVHYAPGGKALCSKRSIDAAIDDGVSDDVKAKPIGDSLANTRAGGLRSRRRFEQWGVC